MSAITANIKLPKLEVAWDTTSVPAKALQLMGLKGFPHFEVTYFYNGGFPEKASLFFAGENGVPEILGTVGGKSAVASGAEITGIANAVYSTGQTEAALLMTAVSLLREIASKDMSVKIGDRDIARANRRGTKSLGMQLITEI